MADQRAWWRRVFDSAESAVAPPLEALVRTEEYARIAATLTWARSTLRHGLADVSAGAWHLVNLPAASDLARLRSQVGALDREVRRLTLRLEASGSDPSPRPPEQDPSEQDPSEQDPPEQDPPVEEAAGDRTERDVERPGPRPTGRRAQHPPGP